jgi:hypothetical protein
MVRWMPAVVLAVSVVGAAAPQARAGSGQWFKRLWASIELDCLRNNAWPDTFLYADREAVDAPFAVMIHNGYRAQNTLGNHHFEDGSSQLTESGALKVRWILTEAPEQFRTVYVQRTDSRELTAERIAAVEEAAARMLPDYGHVEVVETAVPFKSWSAETIDKNYRDYIESMPAPALPKSTSSGEGESQ